MGAEMVRDLAEYLSVNASDEVSIETLSDLQAYNLIFHLNVHLTDRRCRSDG